MRLRCPDCRESFPWDTENPWPKACPCCGEDINNDTDEIVMPFVRSSKRTAIAAAGDQLYYDMEKGSEVRAAVAAELAGCPVSEMSGLKITNMRETPRAGDVAAVPVNNSVTQAMQQAPAGFGFQNPNGLAYSAGTRAGPVPNAGAKFQSAINAHHAELSHHSAVSDRPANEYLNPDYKRRA